MQATTSGTPGENTGWWAGLSGGKKGAIFATGVLIVGTTLFYFFNSGGNSEKKILKSIPDSHTKTQKDEVIVDEFKKTAEGSETKSELVNPEQNQKSETDLPNSGVGCSMVRTTYDRDYDYVKCAGVWYTKSKPNAVTPAAREKYVTWTSLASNEVASARLNSRYKDE